MNQEQQLNIDPKQMPQIQFTHETHEVGALEGIEGFLGNLHDSLQTYFEVRTQAKAGNIKVPNPPRHIFAIAGEPGTGKATIAGQMIQLLQEDNSLHDILNQLQDEGMRIQIRYSSLATIRDLLPPEENTSLAFTPHSSRKASELLGEKLRSQLDEPEDDTMVFEFREAVLIPPPWDENSFDLGYSGMKGYFLAVQERNNQAAQTLRTEFPDIPDNQLQYLLPYQVHGIGLLDSYSDDHPVYQTAIESRKALAEEPEGLPEQTLEQYQTTVRRGSYTATNRDIVSNSGGSDVLERARRSTDRALASRPREILLPGFSLEQMQQELLDDLARDPVLRQMYVEGLLREVFSDLGISPVDRIISPNPFSTIEGGARYHHGLLQDHTRLP